MGRWDKLQGALIRGRRCAIARPEPPPGGAGPVWCDDLIAALAFADTKPGNEIPRLIDGNAPIALACIRKLPIGQGPQRPRQRQVLGSEFLRARESPRRVRAPVGSRLITPHLRMRQPQTRLRIIRVQLQREAERPFRRGQVPTLQRIAAFGVRVECAEHVGTHDVRPTVLDASAPQENRVGELAEFCGEIPAVLGNAHRVVAQLLSAVAEIVQCRGDLSRVSDVHDVAPDQHAGAELLGELLSAVERHGLVAELRAGIVHLQRVRQAHVGPAPECLRQQQLTLIAVHQRRRCSTAMTERDHDVQRGIERAGREFGQYDRPHGGQRDDCYR